MRISCESVAFGCVDDGHGGVEFNYGSALDNPRLAGINTDPWDYPVLFMPATGGWWHIRATGLCGVAYVYRATTRRCLLSCQHHN